MNTSKKSNNNKVQIKNYPSSVIPFMNEWRILCGDGTRNESLVNFEHKNFFYVSNDGETDWMVYKTPSSGVTSKTSSNTITELGLIEHWIPETGGKLTGALKVMHVSTTGDVSFPSSFSVVVGQIHNDEGHEKEPLKIFYKKFLGHEKGSVFWNYEINTKGDNSGRWDYSIPVWGYDFSVVGLNTISIPDEPKDGISLGEVFRYEINVHKGIMYLTFISENRETIKFTKSLLKSEFTIKEDIPKQVLEVYTSKGRYSVERENAYAGEMQYFKEGAYNQANGKLTKSEIYDGDIAKQYTNGSYAEVWFKEASVGTNSHQIKL